ncbi:MAG: hypothetical protein WC071_00040 [Victivallaceae bacterium]
MSESIHRTEVRAKLLNGFWFVFGVVAGSILNYLVLWFNFSPENIVPLARMLGIACFILIFIWPLTIIALLMNKKCRGNDEK